MYDGLEVDVLDLGDADCIVVTKWNGFQAHRILIDGGCGGDADAIFDWLVSRNYRMFEAALCTHAHNDHASGLVKLLQKKDLNISNGWMHDITKHVDVDALRRAAYADDGVKQVVETTKELTAAFGSRGIPIYEAEARQWFMAAMALGCLLEALLYAYFIIWSGDEGNDPAKDEQIPDSLVLNDLLDAAKQIDLLTTIKFKDKFGDHAVQNVVHELRHLRNNIHAGVALRREFDPASFTKKDYTRLKRIFAAVWENFELAL